MTYEITHQEQLVARVAELEQNREINAKEWESLHADYDALQQRNAELVEQLKAYGKYSCDTTQEDRISELKQSLAAEAFESNLAILDLRARNADMVAALRDVAGTPERDKDYAIGELKCRLRARNTLARAESATAAVVKDSLTTEPGAPAQHPDTEIIDWLEVDPKARLAEVRRLIFIDRDTVRDTVREAVHAARKQGGEK